MDHPAKNCVLDSKTLAYEFQMFCSTGRLILQGDVDRVRLNALVESFAIHCRALLHFFFGHDSQSPFIARKRDVLATDFCNWSRQWSEDATLYETAKFQADKHIAHITTDRQNVNFAGGPTSVWQIGTIVQRVVDLMKMFLKLTPRDKLDAGAAPPCTSWFPVPTDCQR